nr:hypothetical protein [Rubellimicrobium mesophilum]
MGDVDADPAAAELLRRVDGGAAAAEGLEHEVAGVGGGGDDAFEEGDGLLGGVAEALGSLGVDGRNVVPNAGQWHPIAFIQKTAELDAPAFFPRKLEPTFSVELFHFLARHRPAVWMWFMTFVIIGKIWPRLRAPKVRQAVNSPFW